MNSRYREADSPIETSINYLKNQAYLKSPSPNRLYSPSCGGINMTIALRSTHPAAASTHVNHVTLTDADARSYLEETGWVATKIVYQDGKTRWVYKAPPVNQSPAVVFHTLCGAAEEYNNRIKNIAKGDESRTRITIGLRRKRQAAGTTANWRNKIQENLKSNKRRPRQTMSADKTEELEAPDPSTGADLEIDSDPDMITPATQNLLCLSDLIGEMDDELEDKLPAGPAFNADSGRRRPEQKLSRIVGHDKTFNDEVEMNMSEARDFLRESGWEVSTVARRQRRDWVYKAPACGIYRAVAYQSLWRAVSEYNSRVRFFNKKCIEQKPLIKLVNGYTHTQNICSQMDEEKPARTIMDEREERLACSRPSKGATKLQPKSSPCSSSRPRRPCPSEETSTEREGDSLSNSGKRKSSANLPERFAAGANTTGHGDVNSASVLGKTFGTFVGDVYEDDRNYFLEIHSLNLKKENMRIFVENGHLIIQATYSSENTSNRFSAICSGALNCRLTLPDDAIQESVTATQLKPGILQLTISKSTRNLTKFEIPIK